MRAYWFAGNKANGSTNNFGDMLTKYMVEKFTKHKVEWALPEEAELFGCGSIIECIPAGFTGTVLTTGKMHENSIVSDLSGSNILAIRGKKSADALGVEAQLGDLGIMCKLLKPKTKKQHRYGFIPHYIDHRQVELEEAHYIDITAGVDSVMRETAKCEHIISSSLHGIILADAFGIMNIWVPHPSVLGNGFKFRDYASSLDEEIVPEKWRCGDEEKLQKIAVRLEKTIRSL